MSKYSTCRRVLLVTTTSPARSGRGRRSTRPSVDELAKGAGLSRPTFYFYFPSKDAVLLSLMEPLIQQADKEFDGAAQRLPSDPRRIWRNGIKTFFTTFGSHSVVARAGTEAMATSPDVRAVWSAFMQKWIEQTAAMIEAERERGAAPDTIPALDLATSLN